MRRKRVDPIQLEIERITGTISKISNGSIDGYEAGLLLEEVISANSNGRSKEDLLSLVANSTGLSTQDETNANILDFIFNPEQSTYKPFVNDKLKSLKDQLK
jgi:hypothetical protein